MTDLTAATAPTLPQLYAFLNFSNIFGYIFNLSCKLHIIDSWTAIPSSYSFIRTNHVQSQLIVALVPFGFVFYFEFKFFQFNCQFELAQHETVTITTAFGSAKRKSGDFEDVDIVLLHFTN